MQLRAVALLADLSTADDACFALCMARGLLAPLVSIWNGDDPLIRLNAIQIFAQMAKCGAAVAWMRQAGIVRGMCAVLETEVGSDLLLDLQRPTVLNCLGKCQTG